MSAIITNSLRILNSKIFRDAISDEARNFYAFVGKAIPWSPDANLPEDTLDTVRENSKRWGDMIALKKIIPGNVSHIIPRFDWVTGTRYKPYSDIDPDLFNHPTNAEISAANSGGYLAGSFYVQNGDNVYKCLYAPAATNSTVAPTGKLTTPITTGDGYIWKYMYTLSASDALKFMTPDWLPVKTLTADDSSGQWSVQAAAKSGSIEVITVTNGGSGYPKFTGGLTAATGTTFTLDNLDSPSGVDDFYNGCVAYVRTGPGAGTSAVVTDYNGTTHQGTVAAWPGTQPDGTSDVEILPKITILGDGTPAAAEAVVVAGVITKITMTDTGGVTTPGVDTPYRFASATAAGGAGTGAILAPVISPIGGHGKDAIVELGGSYLMFDVRIESNEPDFPLANDYRRVGLVTNVTNFGTTTLSTATNLTALKSITLGSVTGTFLPDAVITSDGTGTPTGKIVNITTGSGVATIQYYQDESTGFVEFDNGETVTGVGGGQGVVTSLGNPEVEPFSGDILYIENRRAVVRAPNQAENFKITLEF